MKGIVHQIGAFSVLSAGGRRDTGDAQNTTTRLSVSMPALEQRL